MNDPAIVDRYAQMRRAMVTEQLLTRDISDRAVLKAMGEIPRELFVPDDQQANAYTDQPLDIGFKQTISQPYIVASMTQALELGATSKVLEIGTGSGYQTAVLASIAQSVYSIEIIPEFSERSWQLLARLGFKNLHFRTGDGKAGWPDSAPFDGILVAAATPRVPQAWLDQLKPGGKMVVPVVAQERHQELRCYEKTSHGVENRFMYDVRFVPLQ